MIVTSALRLTEIMQNCRIREGYSSSRKSVQHRPRRFVNTSDTQHRRSLMMVSVFYATYDLSRIYHSLTHSLAVTLHQNYVSSNLLMPYHLPTILSTASNWILKRMKPNRWLPFIVTAWGVVTTLSGLVQNFGGLVAIRLMLGLCEGGLLPGIVSTFHCFVWIATMTLLQILYLSTIYKKHELQLRFVVFH